MPELQRLRAEHAPALLAFERANRDFFAGSVPDRGDAYFADFDARHEALLAEQATGAIAFHVLVSGHEILGRFNLVDLADGEAELGYRLAEKATGRGLATATVRTLCSLAATRYGLHTLRAETTLDNAASRTVLSRTGFVPTGRADFDGRPGLTYARHSPAAATPEFEAFRLRAEADPRVVGLVLSGPRARREVPTARCGHDAHVYVIAADGTETGLAAAESRRGALPGVTVLPLSAFRTYALPGSGTERNRNAFTHAVVLKDTTEGTVSELTAAKGGLPLQPAGTDPELRDHGLN
ncbi:GNAT family N-acetyltransferase [Streptomyces sp. NPDC021093]|uniref:GNAT family N-acetyltransferase n=1 Tax=Streptomyces sp. NPDC021093 TaxID=3365112 RepID=UPI00379A3CD4